MHPTTRLCIALCTSLAFAPSLWALPTHYHLTDLGPYSDVEQISPKGKVAGVNARHGRVEPAVWIHGKARNRTNPYRTGDAHGVNDAGVAVGEVGGTSFQHAVVWRGADEMLDLGHLIGTRHSAATAINSLDDCTVDAAFGREHDSYIIPGCASTRVVINIGSLGNIYTVTRAINDSKQVTGTSALGDGSLHAFLYSQGAMSDLGVLDGDSASEGLGLNDLGHVVGDSSMDPTHGRGFFFDGRILRAIGAFGGTQSLAFCVNHDDVVVGMATDAQQMFHAFVVDEARKDAKLHDLGTMLDGSGAGWTLTAAVGINDAGEIIVWGFAPGDNAPRSALLSPAE